MAGRRAGGRGRSVRRIAAPLAAGDDRAPILREIATKAPLKCIEQLIVASDDVAYEEWFAKQPKVPFGHVDLPKASRPTSRR